MNIKQLKSIFLSWSEKKINHHVFNNKIKYFKKKEIWWAALGKNVGYETDGKHELFERPVLILKVYSNTMCFIAPLTTQIKDPLPWYQIPIICKGNKSVVNITQCRTISSKRLLRKEGLSDIKTYNKIISNFKSQFNEI